MTRPRLTRSERVSLERKALVKRTLRGRGLPITALEGRRGVKRRQLFQALSGTRDIPLAPDVLSRALGPEFDRVWRGGGLPGA